VRGGGGLVQQNRHNAAVGDYLQLLLQLVCMLRRVACA